MRVMRHAVAALALVSLSLTACGGSKHLKAEIDVTRQNKAKLAVVSLAVNDYGNALQGTSDSNVGDLITKKMNEMLAIAEKSFGESWTVVPAESFVAADTYKKHTIGQLIGGVYGPKPGGADMYSFSPKRGDLVKTNLDPQLAAQLCKDLGVDLVVLLYSEWATRTGGMIPTTKALTKNVIGLYDSQGRLLYQGRKDVVGDKSLGAFGKAVVDEATLNVWVGAYEKGLKELLTQM